MDKSSGEKINKKNSGFKLHNRPVGLNRYLQTLQPKTAEYTFFSSAHRTLFWVDHMLGYKTSLSKFERIKIILSIFFPDHSGMKLEFNYRKKNGKSTNMWRLNNMLLKNQWVYESIEEEIRKYTETNENGNITFPNLWDAAKAVPRGKFTAIQGYFKKSQKSQINNLAYHLKELKVLEEKSPKSAKGRK